ncbi:MAG: hypothetical protein ACM3JP_02210 [Betaproteobacteria bacterium]
MDRGETFTELFHVLRRWIDLDRGAWPVIRRKLRFVGVTWRTGTGPNAFRWQQHAAWTASLPAHSVLNVSLDPRVSTYLADRQASPDDQRSTVEPFPGGAGREGCVMTFITYDARRLDARCERSLPTLWGGEPDEPR